MMLHSSPRQVRYALIVLGLATVGAIMGLPQLGTAVASPVAQAQSSRAAISPQSLAAHLKKINAKMYGAFWCPACTKQKELFGSAFKSINYIECDPRGTNPKPEMCKQANIRAYPTWEIHGQTYEGVFPLEGLAQLSGYQGR